jgi:MtN3 and saliva related transmembrane protein
MNISLHNIIGIVAGVLTSASLIPQLVKLIKTKKAEDISIPMLLILFAGIGLWIIYGALGQDWPIIITNSVSLILNFILLVLSISYKGKGNGL